MLDKYFFFLKNGSNLIYIMTDIHPATDEKRAKFFEGVPAEAKKPKMKAKKEVTMTWGKYKSKLVKDIIQFDEKYAQWLHKQEFVKRFADIYDVLNTHFSNTAATQS